MLACFDRLVELYRARQTPHTVIADKLFINYAGGACPIGPAKCDYSITADQARAVVNAVGGHFVRWTDGFGENKCSDYYAVTCNRFTSIDEMKAKGRSEINRGLKNCQVKQVDARWLGENGYEVYFKAFERYRVTVGVPLDEAAFKRYYSLHAPFEDIVQCWGIFHQDRLIGFGICDVYDRVEVNYTMIKVHPDFLPLYPSYALIYRMNEHYLGKLGFEYSNDGFRALVHQTNVQDFLAKKFGFAFNSTNLHVYYRPALKLAVAATYPCRWLLGRAGGRLKALYAMESIRRQSERASDT